MAIDCESREIALSSMSNLFNIDKLEVEDFLVRKNWVSVYEKNLFLVYKNAIFRFYVQNVSEKVWKF